jgi:hypothetical protein
MRLPVLRHDNVNEKQPPSGSSSSQQICALHDYQTNSSACFSKLIRATTINETRQFHKAPSPQKLPVQFLTLLGLHGIASPSPIDPTGYAPKFTLGPNSTSRQHATFSMAPRVTLPTRIWLTDDLIDWYGYSQLIVTHSSAESKLMNLNALMRQVQNFHWLLEPTAKQLQLRTDNAISTPFSLVTKRRAEALSPDADSGDLEFSEDEPDHIEPSSPRPPPAAPPVPPAVSTSNEPTLPGTDKFESHVNELQTETSADNDYGAGLSSTSDNDDPRVESQVAVEKQNTLDVEAHEHNDTINQAQAHRTQVDGQSAARNDDDSDSELSADFRFPQEDRCPQAQRS